MADSISGDVGMYLQCGKLLLDGQRIYVDFIDLNPPLIFFVSVIPALLSNVLKIPLLVSGSITCSALSFIAVLLTGLVLRKYEDESCRVKAPWSGPMLLAIGCLSAFVMFCFGQREYLFMLVWLPYFFLRISRAHGNDYSKFFALVTGILAGIGLAYKPFFLLCPAVLEVVLLWKGLSPKKLLSPEIVGIVLAHIGYGIGFLLLPSESKDAFLHFIIPRISAGYGAFDNTAPVVFFSNLWFLQISSLVMGLALYGISRVFTAWRKSKTADVDEQPKNSLYILDWAILTQLVADIAIIQIQHKGWIYHGIPMLVSTILLIALAVSRMTEFAPQKLRLIFCSTLTFFLVGLSCAWLYLIEQHFEEARAPMPTLPPAGSKVAYLDTCDRPWFVIAADREVMPGYRYLWLFMVPVYENLCKTGKLSREQADLELKKMMADLKEDLSSQKVDLVILKEDHCTGMPDDFNLRKYLEERGLEKALANYKEREHWEHFVYFRRMSEPAVEQ